MSEAPSDSHPPPHATAAPSSCHLNGASRPPKQPVQHPVRRGWRLFIFVSLTLILAGANTWLFADWLWRLDWSGWHSVLLGLFFILNFTVAFGCLHAVFGFIVRRRGDAGRLTALQPWQDVDISSAATAIVVPIYNEDVEAVFERVRVMWESLARTGQEQRFDFFILSDSTNPAIWAHEETKWFEMTRELGALGKLHYRRRTLNRDKKSGNIRDFLNAWGRHFRYMIVLDADSLMQGRTLVSLVKLMEANPTVGLIQTVPGLLNSESLFGRIQQFSSRLFGPIFVAGLNYWVQDGGNYWGHNAIIRVDPFMHNCDLPTLPGKKPFGGHILSHDFVEAALLRREDWQVWLAYDLEGSWEEGPPSLADFAQRDRRWCQGNLQHSLLLFAKGFRGISRLHLIMGILGYVASPLWLAFMLVFAWIKFYKGATGLSDIPGASATPLLRGLTMAEHGFLVFSLSMTLIFLPKFIALLDLALTPGRLRLFGGGFRVIVSVLLETLVSALQAPILMLFHTHFVLTNLLGREVGWGPQHRTADGTAWIDACKTHGWQTFAGLGFAAFGWICLRDSFWWLVPVLVGLVLAIPLSVFSSRLSWGAASRRLGLFLSPEETEPPAEVVRLRERLATTATSPSRPFSTPAASLRNIVVDPYANALHVSLLREKKLNPIYAAELEAAGAGSPENSALRTRLLTDGAEALTQAEILRLMNDGDTIAWLHSRVWTQPAAELHPSWQQSIQRYGH